MTPRLLPVWCVTFSVLAASSWQALAQASGGPGPQSGYTLQLNSRVVLTDVTVTDKKGNPVHGLKASDFRIFDNNKPQEISSFEEHHKDETTPVVQPVLALGVYSNDYLAHPPQVLNILFLDLTNISIEDQMYLDYQLGKFVDGLQPSDQVAIYARTAGASILLQSFTSDHARLRAAIHRIMPRFPLRNNLYLSDFDTLKQIEFYVGQIPGRKNVLWFSGGSTFFLQPDVSSLSVQDGWRAVYNDLEAQRIAIYPIDVRGLTILSRPIMLAQHAVMSNVAEATGGRAVYDYNGLALAANQIIHDDGEYYTLTYSPRDFRYDNKWHKVRVTVPGTYYTLSYRRGYFADGTNSVKHKPDRPRTRLLAGGETAQVQPTSNEPIIFQASVKEGAVVSPPSTEGNNTPPKIRKGTAPFAVHYVLPLDAFQMTTASGKSTVDCVAAVIAFNDKGTVVAHHAQEIAFTLKGDAAAHPAGRLLPLDIEIDLPKGDVYLYVAAWDLTSKRLGTLEIPYHVESSKKTKDAHPPS
jgi:VWFA-related protein